MVLRKIVKPQSMTMILRIFLQFLKSQSPIVISYTKKNSCKYLCGYKRLIL